MALATLGGTALASGTILSAEPERDEPDTEEGPECFACHRSGRATKLLRFSLAFRSPGMRGVGRRVGSILLCEKCWRGTR